MYQNSSLTDLKRWVIALNLRVPVSWRISHYIINIYLSTFENTFEISSVRMWRFNKENARFSILKVKRIKHLTIYYLEYHGIRIRFIWLCWQGSIILIRFERKAGVKDYLGMLLLLGIESIVSLKNSYQCYYRYKFCFQIYGIINHLFEENGKMCRWSF